MDTVLAVVHVQDVFTVIVNKASDVYTALGYRSHRFIVLHVHVVFTVIVNKVSDGYTALTRFIVITVLTVVHVQVVFTIIVNKASDGYTALGYRSHRFIVLHVQVMFTVIVNKASDGYTALTRFIMVTVLSVVHVQVTRRSQTAKDNFKRTLAVLCLCRQTVNVVWAGGSGPFWPELITSAVSLRGLNGM